VQTVSAREHVFTLQKCASECVNNCTYRTLKGTCDEGVPCSSGQGSEALIASLLNTHPGSTHQPSKVKKLLLHMFMLQDLGLQHAV